MAIRILLVEDHIIVREALRRMMEKHRHLEVVGEADNGRDAVLLTGELFPDVVVMDLSLPKLNGVEATRQIVSEHPDVRIVALSMHVERVFVAEMLRAGAAAYVVKSGPFSEVLDAVEAVSRGRKYLSPAVAGIVVEGFLGRDQEAKTSAFMVLTDREREVLQLIAEGQSTKEIATQLQVSPSTVDSHRRQLKLKLSIHNIADLVKYAIRQGLTGLEA